MPHLHLQPCHSGNSRAEEIRSSTSPGQNPTRDSPLPLCCSSSGPLSPRGGTSITPLGQVGQGLGSSEVASLGLKARC